MLFLLFRSVFWSMLRVISEGQLRRIVKLGFTLTAVSPEADANKSGHCKYGGQSPQVIDIHNLTACL